MKRLLWILVLIITNLTISIGQYIPVYAEDQNIPKELSGLFAISAVLMDGDSGRVLYEKNGYEARAMASTTKIMTCILALEQGNLEDVVTASSYAVSRPKVKLGMQEGETFYLKDLLHSLMLESHNDSAVAIAEHLGGSVQGFAKLMNQKAQELKCYDSYFITPNGLDASETVEEKNENGTVESIQKTHSTTAADLARIMRYCIRESPKKDDFLAITRTASYSFSNTEGKRSFSCNNHNAFLSMMDGALSGKTGFTGNAGYCYVGALERDGKTFIVALLGCGWPNNKTYKWSDTKKLMNYGLENFEYRNVFEEKSFDPIAVLNGIPESKNLEDKTFVDVEMDIKEEDRNINLLMGKEEQVSITYEMEEKLDAPVEEGTIIGHAKYYLGENLIRDIPVVTRETVHKISYFWCAHRLLDKYLCGSG